MQDLDNLEAEIGIEFPDKSLLNLARVHRSYLNENPSYQSGSNERLEFLGDAVLGMVSAEYLFGEFPDLSEGELTSLRSALVNTYTLARWAKDYRLGDFLLMGRGEEATNGRSRPSILANSFEALLAAIYLAFGMNKVRQFLIKHLEPEAHRIMAAGLLKDYKSLLQETVQRRLKLTPRYRTLHSYGPDHARQFLVQVEAGDQALATGSGTSKRSAQQDAARHALESLSPS